MNLRTLAFNAAVLKVLGDEIAARLTLVKDATAAAFDDAGATQTFAALPDGTAVATVSLAGSEGKSAFVLNENEFLQWMVANHPEEIIAVVRDNAKKKILDHCKAAGAPVDENGERIPGVVVRDSTPYVSVRFKAGGKDAVVTAWQAGALKDIELLAPRAVEAGEAA